jgi:hypothetical protein
MKQLLCCMIVFVLAASGCKKDDAGPTNGGSGSTTSFEFVAGRSWIYNGQSYQTNGTPLPATALQASLTVLTTGQPIGGMAQAAVLQTSYTQDAKSQNGTVTVAYDQDRFLVYNGTTGSPTVSPSFPGWNTLFDFKKDLSVRPVFSFDSTYQITMHSGGVLHDRVRYNATMQYSGDESISAFNTSGIACSKYLYTFTYDAVVDTGGVVLFSGNVINATVTIWFSPGIGFVRLRGDMSTRVKLQSLGDLRISHDPAAGFHMSPAVTYYYFNYGFFVYETFQVNAGAGTLGGYAIFDGFSKSF